MAPLLEAVRTQDSQKAIEWSQSDQWATVEQVIAASSGAGASTSSRSMPQSLGGLAASLLDGPRSSPHPQTSWTCSRCTYLNSPDTFSCEMCTLPR